MKPFSMLFNENEKAQAIADLSSLIDNPGWKTLMGKIVKSDVEDIADQVLNPFSRLSEDREKWLKFKREYLIMLSQIPEKIIDALKTNKDIVEDFDPYFKNIKEIKAVKG